MTISEKSAYLKGLMEGMNLNTESNEGKMIAAIVDLLGDMAKRVTHFQNGKRYSFLTIIFPKYKYRKSLIWKLRARFFAQENRHFHKK